MINFPIDDYNINLSWIKCNHKCSKCSHSDVCKVKDNIIEFEEDWFNNNKLSAV